MRHVNALLRRAANINHLFPEFIMPTLIGSPARIEAAGNKPKIIEEYIGRVNSRHEGISVAKMTSPGGWEEPGQTPEFE